MRRSQAARPLCRSQPRRSSFAEIHVVVDRLRVGVNANCAARGENHPSAVQLRRFIERQSFNSESTWRRYADQSLRRSRRLPRALARALAPGGFGSADTSAERCPRNPSSSLMSSQLAPAGASAKPTPPPVPGAPACYASHGRFLGAKFPPQHCCLVHCAPSFPPTRAHPPRFVRTGRGETLRLCGVSPGDTCGRYVPATNDVEAR